MGRFLEIANRIVAEERRIEDTLDDLPDVQRQKTSDFSAVEKVESEVHPTDRQQKISRNNSVRDLNYNDNQVGLK